MKLEAFAPGKDPVGLLRLIEDLIARKLPSNGRFRYVVNNGTRLMIEGDFNRFDGSQCEPVFELMFAISRALFLARCHAQHDDVTEQQRRARFVGGKGKFTYDAYRSMTSGSHDTTIRNTQLNLFTSYCSLRELGMSRYQARHHLSPAFGDDNANNEIVTDGPDGTVLKLSDTWVRVCADLRLKLEIEQRPHGVIGFLSRYYSFDKMGVTGSIIDLARTIPKITMLARANTTDEDFVKKFSSLLMLTGEHTPVVSAYV